MENSCTLQIYIAGAWQDAATLSLTGPREARWRAGVYTGYAIGYAVEHLERRDAAALSAAMPVKFSPRWSSVSNL